MKTKPVVPRAKARADAEGAADHYLIEAGPELALGFINALEQTYRFIGEVPGAGSPRWSHDLNIPGLRSQRVEGFPWLVFYHEAEGYVDVWRILHAKRDIPAWMVDESHRGNE